jgi:magnesium-transporting ATPase (P-type)
LRLYFIFFIFLFFLCRYLFLRLCKLCGTADDSWLLACLCYSLGVEPVDKDVVKQKPRDVKEPMITRSLIVNVLLSAFIIIVGTLWVFKREVRNLGETEVTSSGHCCV